MNPTFFVEVATAVALSTLLLAPRAADASCPDSPRPLCRQFASTRARIDATSGAFEWRATGGPSSTLADFGSPAATTTYSLCAWNEDSLLVSTEIPAAASCAGQPCWSARGSSGLRYRNDDAAEGTLARLELGASSKPKTKLRASGPAAPGAALPATGRLTFQLLRDDSDICFEASVPLAAMATNDAASLRAKAKYDPLAPAPALASGGCGGAAAPYASAASSTDSLVHDGITRTFRVHLPAGYDDSSPVPVVFLLHGGFGSGSQIESSSRMLEVAEANGFVVVSPDGYAGVSGIRAWNAGLCCGEAETGNIDDVGFVAAVLDRMEASLCIDRRRVFAAGMSNGAMLSHRLACEFASRFAAVTTVSGTDMVQACDPARPVSVLSIHGSDDLHVPYDGGLGCGPADTSFTSVPLTITRWKLRGDCADAATSSFPVGDATCTTWEKCAAGTRIESCVIDGGGHRWPGGQPPAGDGIACPSGYQSQLLSASEQAWSFFQSAVAP